MPIDHDDLKTIRLHIEAGLADRAPHERVWAAITREYMGEGRDLDHPAKSQVDDPDDRLAINYLLSLVNTILPVLLANDPALRALPRTPEQAHLSTSADRILDHLWRSVGGLEVELRAALHALLYGHAVTKVGWSVDEEGGAMEPAPVVEGEARPVLDDDTAAALAAAKVPLAAPEALPFFRLVAPWDFVMPPGIDSVADAPWVAERIVMHIDEARAVKWFELPPDLEPDTYLDPRPAPGGTGPLGQVLDALSRPEIQPEHVVVYEYRRFVYDGAMKRKEVVHLLWKEGADPHVLSHQDDAVEVEGWPYDVLQFVTTPAGVYASRMSEMGSVRQISRRLNEEWALILDHHRRSQRRKLVANSTMSEDDIREWLEDDGDLSVLPTNMEDASTAVYVIPEAPPPSDTALVLGGLNRAMFEVSGLDALQRGAIPEDATATAANIANNVTQTKLGIRVRRMEKHIAAVGRKLLAVARQFLAQPLVVRLTNRDEPEFLTLDPRDLRGEFDLVVEPGSTLPRDPASREQSLVNMLQGISLVVQSLAPAVQAGVLPPETMQRFVDEVLVLYQRDPEQFRSPLSGALQRSLPARQGARAAPDDGMGAASGVADEVPGAEMMPGPSNGGGPPGPMA